MSDVAYDPFGSRQAGFNYAQKLSELGANRQAGGQLASGNYGAAANTLYRSGDIAGGQQVLTNQAAQDTAARARRTETTAQQLDLYKRGLTALEGALPQGPEAVVAQWQQIRPLLAQTGGATPDQLVAFDQMISADPVGSLRNIRAAIGQEELKFQKTGDTLRVFQGNNPVPVANYDAPRPDYSLGTTRFSGQTNQPVAQGYIAPEIIQQDPTKNVLEVSPGVAPGAVGGDAQPRGIRNNNPGNIEDGAFAQSLPGYVGSDGRFAIFDTPENGGQAAPRLLQSYISRGYDTPAEIINRWAPPSDNNPTDAYAQYVAQRAGIGVNDTVTPDKIPLVAAAIREFENGQRGPSQGPSQAGGPRVLASAQQGTAGGTVLTPEEVASVGLAPGTVAQRSSTGQISVLQAAPGQGRQGNPTEAQNKDSFNANRMSRAGQIINNLERDNYDYGRAQLGGQLTENYRRYNAAAEEWTDSILRLTTGAAATKDEIASNRRTYFPMPGDSPAVREQKQRQRAAVEQDALARGEGGRSAAATTPQAAQLSNRPPAPAGRQYVPGIRDFALTDAQVRARQQIVSSGANSRAPLGSAQNPRYANPDLPVAQSINNLPRGQYIFDPNGVLRGPKP